MPRLDYRLTLMFQAPLLSHASGAVGFGTDAALQRYRGTVVLNGSLLRGNLRHALQAMAVELAGEPEGLQLASDINRWFGVGADRGESQRAALGFDFFWRLDPASVGHPPAQDQRFRTEISDTGAAAHGQLLVIEAPFAIGERPVFSGELAARFADEDEQRRCERWLRKALSGLGAVGALKGVGFGRLLSAELTALTPVFQVRSPGLDAPPPGADRLGLILSLDRPFHAGLSALHQPQGNRWLHQDSIPGLVLKGALAQALDGDGQRLADDLGFDDLVVCAALPAPAAAPTRRLPLPLSLTVVSTEAGFAARDLALEAAPCCLRVDGGPEKAPTFLPDWKEPMRDEAERAIGQAPLNLARWLSVRTSIEPDDEVAKEGALFALECTDPFGHVWCTDLDLSALPDNDRPRVQANLSALLAGGLTDIGKTRARARVALAPEPSRRVPAATEIQPLWPDGPPEDAPITGQARFPLLLVSPARLLPAGFAPPATNGQRQLWDEYDMYFRRASDGLLGLGHCFAQQELVGGDFYHLQYRGGGDYQPEWLTVPGSVFVLRPLQLDLPAIQACLHSWLHSGLPPAADRTAEDWRSDPFLPQNGFGEISLDWPSLRTLRPSRAECVFIDQPGDPDDHA